MKPIYIALIILIVLYGEVRAWSVDPQDYPKIALVAGGAFIFGMSAVVCLHKKIPALLSGKNSDQLVALLNALHVENAQQGLEKIASVDKELQDLQALLARCGDAQNAHQAHKYIKSQIRTLVNHTLSVLETVKVYLDDGKLSETIREIRETPDELWDQQTINSLNIEIARVITQRRSQLISEQQSAHECTAAIATFFGPNSNTLNEMVKARDAGKSPQEIVKLLPERLEYTPPTPISDASALLPETPGCTMSDNSIAVPPTLA